MELASVNDLDKRKDGIMPGQSVKAKASWHLRSSQMRLWPAAMFALLAACGGDALTDPADLEAGRAELRISGTLLVRGSPAELPDRIDATACERLGWLNLYSIPPVAVAVYRSGDAGFETGTVTMGQPDPTGDPGGHLNGVGGWGSLYVVAGTTTFTEVSGTELRGELDWTLAYPDHPEDGSLRLQGTFRSLRTGDACMPQPGRAVP